MQRIIHANGIITYSFTSTDGLPLSVHVSTRHGGVSPAPWDTLNFSILRGDDRERVYENRVRLASALGLEGHTIVRAQQVHGSGVAKVGWEDTGKLMEGCDALVTDAIELPLQLVFGDCAPLLFYDRVRHVLGVCHAGWRGTVNGAGVATLWAMQAGYDSQPQDIIACIGPSIGPQSYEVGEDVLSYAYAKLPKAEQLFTYPNGQESRPYFDLWQANANQLIGAGIPAQQIEISGIDTAQSTHDFFSHRAEKGRCGLFSMTAWLHKK